jgi:Family of unknown function (DUF6129)
MDPIRIDQVAAVVERAGLCDQTLSALREAFADIHFTWCRDDDIGEGRAQPVRESARFRIYLVDGRSHCLTLTRDPESATGLVLAEIDADDPPDERR